MKKFIELATSAAVAIAVLVGVFRRSPAVMQPATAPDAGLPTGVRPSTSHLLEDAPSSRNRLVSIGRSLMAAVKEDRLPLMAAAAAFYGFLALVPGVLAVVTIYGLVADPSEVAAQLAGLAGAVPGPVVEFLEHQLTSIAGAGNGGLGVGLALAIAGLLWSTSKAAQVLLKAQNAVYGVDEDRGFAKQRLVAIAVTAGALVLIVSLLLASALVPRLTDAIGNPLRTAINVGQWGVLAFVAVAALAALYRWGPNRNSVSWRPVVIGATAATAVWLASSLGLAFYVSRFNSYNETYGTLGSIIVVQMWLFVTYLAVLVGSELDAVLAEADALESA